MPNSEVYARAGGAWRGRAIPGGALPPPSTCGFVSGSGRFLADWPDVEAAVGQLVRYDYRVGTSPDLTPVLWRPGSRDSKVTVEAPAVPHYLQVRSVAAGPAIPLLLDEAFDGTFTLRADTTLDHPQLVVEPGSASATIGAGLLTIPGGPTTYHRMYHYPKRVGGPGRPLVVRYRARIAERYADTYNGTIASAALWYRVPKDGVNKDDWHNAISGTGVSSSIVRAGLGYLGRAEIMRYDGIAGAYLSGSVHRNLGYLDGTWRDVTIRLEWLATDLWRYRIWHSPGHDMSVPPVYEWEGYTPRQNEPGYLAFRTDFSRAEYDYFRVEDVSSEVLGAPSASFGPVNPDEAALTAPSSCALTAGAGSFVADWDDVPVPAGTSIGRYEYRVAASATGVVTASWVPGTAESRATIPVSAVGSYYLQLRAVTSGGTVGQPSQTFGPVSVTTMGTGAYFIAPAARGKGDGSSLADADGGLEAIDNAARAGKRDIRLAAHLGVYDPVAQNAPVDFDGACSGTAAVPTWVHGVGSDGVTPQEAVIRGNRRTPWTDGGARGIDLFRFRGAQHMRFSELRIESVGVAFDFQSPGTNYVIERITARNVQRFQENAKIPSTTTTTYPPADVTNVIIRDCDVRGFSKQAVRFRYNSSNCRVDRVHADSERQWGDNFAMAFFLDGTAHDITFTDCVGLNCVQILESGEVTTTSYWNADAFVCEEGNYNITYVRCRGEGCTDGGFDLKGPVTGSNLRLIECVARRNKRNFRFHDVRGAVMDKCRGENPNKEGGSGAACSVWLGSNTLVTVNDSHFVEQVRSTYSLFRQAVGSELRVNRGSLTLYPDGDIRRVEGSPTTYVQSPETQVIRKTP